MSWIMRRRHVEADILGTGLVWNVLFKHARWIVGDGGRESQIPINSPPLFRESSPNRIRFCPRPWILLTAQFQMPRHKFDSNINQLILLVLQRDAQPTSPKASNQRSNSLARVFFEVGPKTFTAQVVDSCRDAKPNREGLWNPPLVVWCVKTANP